MHSTALSDRPPRAVIAFGIAAVAVLLAREPAAMAQTCDQIPDLPEDLCQGIGESIQDYQTCYRALYDEAVIPAFQYIAECSHERADEALQAGLESAAEQVVGTIRESVAVIEDVMTDPAAAPALCMQELNFLDQEMEPIIADERDAGDLDAYRRETYTPDHFVLFTDLVLGARQNRAICDPALQTIREQLVLLSHLKARHLDYCQVLRDSAQYESASRIQSLAQWTVVDPDIDFDFYFNTSVTWNPQCAYFDFSESSTDIRYTPCVQATVEYQQTLSELDAFAIGWLADNRDIIVAVTAATATTVASAAGAGAEAGPIGAVVGAVVGAVISGIHYLVMRHEIDELNDMIADKEEELREVVEENYITEDQFDDRLEALCGAWEPVVEARIEAILGGLDAQRHVDRIDGYYEVSDKLHGWYNELFLWATEPGPDGRRFLDELAEQAVLAKKDEFDRRIFRARTNQEVAVQRNFLVNLKAQTSRLDCTDITPRERRRVQAELRAGVNVFNLTCSNTMETLAARTGQSVPFTASESSSDVFCAYAGFRPGVASLEVRAGVGFAADMTIRDSAGGAMGELTNVTSDTDWAQGAMPGFHCWSETGQSFGTSAASRLAPGTYGLRLPDNIYGFEEAEAAPLRTFVQDIDKGMRFKASVCNRQLGTPIDLPRIADACGIPVNF